MSSVRKNISKQKNWLRQKSKAASSIFSNKGVQFVKEKYDPKKHGKPRQRCCGR